MTDITALAPVPTFNAAAARDDRRAELVQDAHALVTELSRIETDEDKLSVLMGLGALVAEVAALATQSA